MILPVGLVVAESLIFCGVGAFLLLVGLTVRFDKYGREAMVCVGVLIATLGVVRAGWAMSWLAWSDARAWTLIVLIAFIAILAQIAWDRRRSRST